ncbi:MAG: RbsD/FucU family protein [Victivallaceae bacterium]|nr:RbsD/FucU family protein [Victivallaceae bacterium]
MLKTTLIHPQILSALASSGHFSQVLIADGNFPVATCSNPLSKKVFLNLAPGVLNCMQVLQVLLTAIPVQSATVMQPPTDFYPEIHTEYRQMLDNDIEITEMERWSFYDRIKSSDTSLIIATGEQRRFANLLLTIGAVKLSEENF